MACKCARSKVPICGPRNKKMMNSNKFHPHQKNYTTSGRATTSFHAECGMRDHVVLVSLPGCPSSRVLSSSLGTCASSSLSSLGETGDFTLAVLFLDFSSALPGASFSSSSSTDFRFLGLFSEKTLKDRTQNSGEKQRSNRTVPTTKGTRWIIYDVWSKQKDNGTHFPSVSFLLVTLSSQYWWSLYQRNEWFHTIHLEGSALQPNSSSCA